MWPHQGSWGTPDFGITEWIGDKFGSGRTSQGGSNILGASTAQQPTQPAPAPTNKTPAPTGGGTTGGGVKTGNGTSTAGGGSDVLTQAISSAGNDQRNAAQDMAEAARQRALGAYKVVQKAGEQAKGQAKDTYDWIIGTIGSQKEDLLNKTTTNYEEQQGNYEMQEKKTKDQYDEARFEIRSTYQELAREQEKILRGAGMGNSSRSLEAQLRMNRLLGKDISKLSTNEADALALIGNAVSTLGKKYQDTKDSIEKEASGALGKAQLEYKQQLDAINLNMFKSEQDREDAYRQAEAQLSSDIAKINTWVAQSQVQVKMQLAQLSTNLDNFIVDMTDLNGGLARDLTTNQEQAQNLVSSISKGFTFDTVDVGQASKQAVKFTSKPQDEDSLFNQDMLQRAALFGGGTPTEAGASATLLPTGQAGGGMSTRDPLSLAIG